MGRSGLCTICGVSFKRLDEHMKHVHVQTEDYLNCDLCSKTFTKKKSKSDHMMKVHKNRFSCAICPKEYIGTWEQIEYRQ